MINDLQNIIDALTAVAMNLETDVPPSTDSCRYISGQVLRPNVQKLVAIRERINSLQVLLKSAV